MAEHQLSSQFVLSESKKLVDIKHRISTEMFAMLKTDIEFYKLNYENLNLTYSIIFPIKVAHSIYEQLEKEIQYLSDEESVVKVYGKWYKTPRKQAAYGDPGLTYTFAGKTVNALEWTELTKDLINLVNAIVGENFNFVLINRYNDGLDHIGEHQDKEEDLDLNAPIASLSFGAIRDFVFRHKDHRHKQAKIKPLKIKLESGSLLIMNVPTNKYWYHSLPIRKKCCSTRINLTFRKIKIV